MIMVKGGTKVGVNQIRLDQIFTVERVLSSRGFSVKTEGSGEDTVLCKSLWSAEEANLVFSIFNNTTLRNELLEYIENKMGKSAVSNTVTQLIDIKEFKKDRQNFSTTYEWYVGELLVRKFMAFSSSYGVTVNDICRNSDGGTSGDFDVLSILGDMNLIYLECKSGKTKQKSVKSTLERSISLHCTASVFIRQKITTKGLKQQLSFKHPVFGCKGEVIKLNIKNLPDSTIYKWFNCYFVDASESGGDIENKLKAVLRIIEASRVLINISTEPSEEEYKSVGYGLLK
jgi:hypothetical protein